MLSPPYFGLNCLFIPYLMVLLEDGDERVGLCPLDGTKNRVRITWDNCAVHTKSQSHFPHSPFTASH